VQSPIRSRGTRATGSKAKKEDIKALKGQKEALTNQSTEMSLAKMAITQSLIGKLNNDFNGDMNSFLADKDVNNIIRGLHRMDAVHLFNKTGAEEEQRLYKEGITNAKNNNAVDNYATDSRGLRYYKGADGKIYKEGQMFDKDGNLVKGNTTLALTNAGHDYLTIEELYNEQRSSLGIDNNGRIQEGEWVDSFDNKAGYFTKEARQYIQDAGSIETTRETNLVKTPYKSYLKYSKHHTKDNYNNMNQAVVAMKGKLSPLALRDAKQQYWKSGLDKLIGVNIVTKTKNGSNVETKYYSPKDYQRIFIDGDYTKEEGADYLAYKSTGGEKNVLSDEKKFNEFIVAKSVAIKTGNRELLDNWETQYKKLTDSEVGSILDVDRKTTYAIVTDPLNIKKMGEQEGSMTIFKGIKTKDEDGRAIKQKQERVNIFTYDLDPMVFDQMQKMNNDYEKRIKDSNGEIILENVEKVPYKHIVFKGNVLSEELSKKLLFAGYNSQVAAMPGISNGDWDIPDDDEAIANNRSYQSIRVYLTKDLIKELEEEIALETDNNELSDFDKGTTDKKNLSVVGTSDLNGAWLFGVDANGLTKATGGEPKSVDGFTSNDVLEINMWGLVSNSAPLNKQSLSASKYNKNVENQINSAQERAEAKANANLSQAYNEK